jgi:hypothetical protein
LLATEPLLRFLTLWISFEALEPRLAEHYSVDSRGFQGLRRLAAEHGCSSEDITIALGVRQDLFHARRVLPADVRTRAQSLLPTLERLVVAGWLTVLGAPGELAGFPGSAVTPYPVQLTVKAPITGADPTAMTSDTVPYFVGRPTFRRLAPESAGAVTLSIETKMKLQNAAESGEPEVRLMGPAGPNVFVPERGTLSARPDC